MTRARAAYMEWAKKRPAARIDLAGSNLLGCSLADLPGARQAVDLAGESPNGYRPLVEAIAATYGVDPDQVATASGCSGANFLTMAALLDAGDEVLIEAPHYDPLPAAARMLGAAIATFPRRFEDRYRIDPERVAASIRPQTRLIVVTNPHNPSGVLASEAEMMGLSGVAERAGIHVLVDEVYLDTVFRNRPRPAATLSPVLLSTNSLTKAYGLASLRCGWTLASPPLAEKIRRTRDVVDVWSPIPSDRLSVIAFENLDALSRRARGILEPNRDRMRSFLAERRELECVPPAATTAFPRLARERDAGSFVSRLFDTHGVAVVPGAFFDAPAHFRVSLGCACDQLEAGLTAISAFLEETG